jgi:hypothetical protein
MKNEPYLKIYLAEATRVKLESATDFLGRPVDLSFALSDVKGGPTERPALGKLIHAILSDWHADEFDAAGARAPEIRPLFGDLDVVHQLIAKSLKQKTRVYVEAINHLIADHDDDEQAQFWDVLAQDWPLLQKSIP